MICTYKSLSFAGEVISTKRDELDSIISMMNIQIDNPISVLNQDVSRTFLVTSKPDEKYNLFMKATLLDAIENNYKEALGICEEEYTKLKQYSAVCTLHLFYFTVDNHFLSLTMFQALAHIKGEIQKLKESIHRLEEIDESRDEVINLEKELQWATVSFSLKKINITEVILRLIVLLFRRLRRKLNFAIYRRA